MEEKKKIKILKNAKKVKEEKKQNKKKNKKKRIRTNRH